LHSVSPSCHHEFPARRAKGRTLFLIPHIPKIDEREFLPRYLKSLLKERKGRRRIVNFVGRKVTRDMERHEGGKAKYPVHKFSYPL
jgi:hypothetical protein